MPEKINYLEKLNDKVKVHLRDIDSRKKEILKLQGELSAKIDYIASLMNDITTMKLKLKDEEEKNSQITKEKEKLTSEKTTAVSEIESLKKKIAGLESELSRLKPKS